jgi:cytochrome c-type biogenesis protein CcmH
MFLASPSFAVQPDEILPDPALEQRARNISENLRCMVCQNQSIDESDAPLAKDLRLLVRDRLKQGDTDEDIIEYLVERYGAFVLLKPRFTAKTFILWLSPFLIILGGLCLYFLYRKQRVENSPLRLSEEEENRLAKLLEQSEL